MNEPHLELWSESRTALKRLQSLDVYLPNISLDVKDIRESYVQKLPISAPDFATPVCMSEFLLAQSHWKWYIYISLLHRIANDDVPSKTRMTGTIDQPFGTSAIQNLGMPPGQPETELVNHKTTYCSGSTLIPSSFFLIMTGQDFQDHYHTCRCISCRSCSRRLSST